MKPPQKNQVICGSNLEVVKSWPANCIDSVCTDPPYGLEFMGKDWDKFNTNYTKRGDLGNFKNYRSDTPAYPKREHMPAYYSWMLVWAKAMLRITKPGGFLLCFGGTRTYHRLACAIEDAGWEIRDCMMWLYGSGFPKSHNISKAIDKAARGFPQGTNRIDPSNPNAGKYKTQRTEGKRSETDKGQHFGAGPGQFMKEQGEKQITTPKTDLAQLWDGYGTALKPAWEPIIVAMKPLNGTFAHNAETHGVAGLNIDGGRIGTSKNVPASPRRAKQGPAYSDLSKDPATGSGWDKNVGRWPANLILDENVAEGESWKRYFYCPKTSRRERNMGMEDCENKLLARSGGAQGAENRGEKEYLQKHIGLNRVAVVKNNHPTVKPLALMKYLCTLLKMPDSDQIILDPFLGSGTTGIACKELGINFIGIEKEPEYCQIAIKRIAALEGTEVTLHTDTSPAEVPQTIPCHDEHRQRIINAASAGLRRKKDGF